MRHTNKTLVIAACVASVLGGAASAQSTGAPAGRDPATAPGGTTGMAGPRNEAEAIRSGDAVAVPPGAGGVPVPPPVVMETAPAGSAGEPPIAPQARP